MSEVGGPIVYSVSGPRPTTALLGFGAARSRSCGRGGLTGGLLFRLLRRLAGRRSFRLTSSVANELDDRHRRVVSTARTELDDSGVPTRTSLEALGQIYEDLLDQVDLL